MSWRSIRLAVADPMARGSGKRRMWLAERVDGAGVFRQGYARDLARPAPAQAVTVTRSGAKLR